MEKLSEEKERKSREDLVSRAASFERDAYNFRMENKIDQVFHAFDEAGKLYRYLKEHLKVAVCFASAATCWNIHTGCNIPRKRWKNARRFQRNKSNFKR